MQSWLSMRVLSPISAGSGFLSFMDLFWFFHRRDSALLRQYQIQWRLNEVLSWCILHPLPARSTYMLHQQTLIKTFWGIFSPFTPPSSLHLAWSTRLEHYACLSISVVWKHTESGLNVYFCGLMIQNNTDVTCHMPLSLSLCCLEIMFGMIHIIWLLKEKTPWTIALWSLSYKLTPSSPSC